jgi:Porin subfamily
LTREFEPPHSRPALGGCGAIQLTTAWSASAAFEHLWTPALKTSWYGSYVNLSHNHAAKTLICNSGGNGASAAASGNVFEMGAIAVTGCDPDWSSWNVGSRTQWEPVKGLVMGVDVIYNKLNTARPNFAQVIPLQGPANSALYAGGVPNSSTVPGPGYQVRDMDAVTTTFRIQRDFLP